MNITLKSTAETIGKLYYYVPWLFIPLLFAQIVSLSMLNGFSPDEHVHIHYMWLIHKGLNANIDFMCPYPTIFYRLFGFTMDIFTLNQTFFINARIISLVFIAAAALMLGKISKISNGAYWPGIIAILVPSSAWYIETLRHFRPDMFSYVIFISALLLLIRWPNSYASILTASFLAVISVLIMPKHILLVLGAGIGFLTSCFLSNKDKVAKCVLSSFTGCILAIAFALTVIRPELSTLNELFVLMFKTGTYNIGSGTNITASFFSQLITRVFWPMAILLLCMPAALLIQAVLIKINIFRFNHLSQQYRFISFGVLSGALLQPVMNSCPYIQYHAVLFIAAAVIFPLIVHLVPLRWAVGVTSVLLINIFIISWPDTIKFASSGSTIQQMELQERLLRIIPANESVVSISFTAPAFRSDPTYIHCDDVHYKDLAPASKRSNFTEEGFIKRLESSMPAYFCFFTLGNQSSEYISACQKFLSSHANSYSAVDIPWEAMPTKRLQAIIRNDILSAHK